MEEGKEIPAEENFYLIRCKKHGRRVVPGDQVKQGGEDVKKIIGREFRTAECPECHSTYEATGLKKPNTNG